MTSTDNPRERLLEAAGEIFAEKGFKGATVREIIDRAGVNIAAVNYYFRDKERLYIEAVKHGACVEADEQLGWPAGTPPAVKLADFIRFHVIRLLAPDKPAWHARLIMRELMQPSAACTELVRDYIEPKSHILGGILEELLPPETSRQQQFLTACSIMGQILFYCTHKPIVLLLLGDRDQPYRDTAALAEHITGFTLRALGIAEHGQRRAAARSRGVAT
ncbi:MAG TPA: CerR family C-terminal domain-containing protein [Gemmataceae bacterium]|nr:CerR family C-terminal domain-containing protein [Gemmataceae bacterium]